MGNLKKQKKKTPPPLTWQDPSPRDGESVRIYSKVLDEQNILLKCRKFHKTYEKSIYLFLKIIGLDSLKIFAH